MRAIAYVTDVEGRWEKLVDFANANEHVDLDANGRITVREDAVFIFGGDAVDRGPDSVRVVEALVDAAERQPDRAILLAGNRDINKMRLPRELSGKPPSKAPGDLTRPNLLRWILTNTMGAKYAFDMRAAELARDKHDVQDEDVVLSFLLDVAPEGPLTRYLSHAQLAFREGNTLIVHGAIGDQSLGAIPDRPFESDVDRWIDALNAWYREQIDAFRRAPRDAAWEPLRAYHAPVPGKRTNDGSVIYGRMLDEHDRAALPARGTRERLLGAGISRVLVGHTPIGDAPAILRADGFELVMSDNSYGRLERGVSVSVLPDRLRVDSRAKLDDGAEEHVVCDLALSDRSSPIGKRDPATGQLVKGQLAGDRWHLHRPLADFRVEQVGITNEELGKRVLVEPT